MLLIPPFAKGHRKEIARLKVPWFFCFYLVLWDVQHEVLLEIVGLCVWTWSRDFGGGEDVSMFSSCSLPTILEGQRERYRDKFGAK